MVVTQHNNVNDNAKLLWDNDVTYVINCTKKVDFKKSEFFKYLLT